MAMASPSSPQQIGRYEILGELGKGAMGVVYKARDPNIGRLVALKTMRLDVHGMEAQEMLLRFKNEARAAGVLNHSNIVTIYDAGEHDGLFYIAMEYIEGTTLQKTLNEEGIVPIEQVLDLSRQICSALDYAHSHKIIHRDIKPANIMIEADGRAKIMDFGIAKAEGTQLTTAGQVVGTPNYMSPEQVKGRPLDGRSDLWSFGVILYEMVTGEKPFSGQTVTTIIYKIVHENPIPPKDLDSSVHPGLSAVIQRALAKHPDQRYQKGADLVHHLINYKSIGVDTASLPQDADAAHEPAPAAAPPPPAAAKPPAPPAKPVQPASTAAAKPAPAAAPARPPAVHEDETQLAGSHELGELAGAAASVKHVVSSAAIPAAKPAAPSGAVPAAKPAAPSGAVPAAKPAPPHAVAEAKATVPAPKVALPQLTTNQWLLVAVGVLALLMVVISIGVYQSEKNKPGVTPAETAVAPGQPSGQPVESQPAAAATSAPEEREGASSTAPAETAKGAKARGKAKPEVAAAAPAAEPPKPAAPANGTVRIISNPPGAKVEIDGWSEPAWVTPFNSPNLSAGQHKVVISKAGFATETKTVEVTAGSQAIVATVMRTIAAPSRIEVSSNPGGASILLDGKPTGRNTPAVIEVPKGEHTVGLRKLGYVDASVPAKVGEGETAHVSQTLKSGTSGGSPFGKLFGGGIPEGMGALQVKTKPKGATVTINGETAPRTTPFKIVVDPGTYSVTVSMDGHQSQTQSVTVEKGKSASIDLELKK